MRSEVEGRNLADDTLFDFVAHAATLRANGSGFAQAVPLCFTVVCFDLVTLVHNQDSVRCAHVCSWFLFVRMAHAPEFRQARGLANVAESPLTRRVLQPSPL